MSTSNLDKAANKAQDFSKRWSQHVFTLLFLNRMRWSILFWFIKFAYLVTAYENKPLNCNVTNSKKFQNRQNHNAFFYNGSFQPADLSSSSSHSTGFNRNPFAIREVKCCICRPAYKIPSVIPLAVIVCFLIYQVSHYFLYLYVKWKV